MAKPAAPQELVAHYEQLRREALRPPIPGGPGLGLALFLRGGMTAWMQAWSECPSRVEPGSPPHPRVDETIPADTRRQITALLAGMILCQQQEAIS